MAAFSIDGVEYPGLAVISVKRSFSVLDGENTGRNMQGDMIRDIIGTYYNYTIELDSTELSLAEYDSLYQVISAPSESHDIIMPYGQNILEFKGYISNGEDDLFSMENDRNRWQNLTFNIVAKSPARRPV